jgi:hypothetical protein
MQGPGVPAQKQVTGCRADPLIGRGEAELGSLVIDVELLKLLVAEAKS